MALSDERIEEICWTEVDQRLRSFARAIEAEVRKECEPLIRQMLEALELWTDGYDDGPYQYHDGEAVKAAIIAARAWLRDTP